MKKDVTVKLDDNSPESAEVLARSIIQISNGMVRLLQSGLTKKTIALLVKDATGVPMSQTLLVLDALPRLAELYVIPERGKK